VVPENKPEPPKPLDAPPPPPEAPPEPAAPAPKAEARPKDDPYDAPPPPAQAAKVLTQKADPDEIEDLTGNTIVSGEGTAAFGQQSAQGKGDKPVLNPAASLTGVPGGTGTSKGPPPPPQPTGPDLSRAATPSGGSSWSCPFPPEADADQIDEARASIVVTVRPDGTPLSVSIVSDPGHGFGRAARMCALTRRFTPALDKAGQPITGSTVPINVRFTR
jgi:protein TonB